MISIKINKKPDLPLIKMNCDEPLHNKLDEYELTKFMNCHSTNLFLGKPKSGKSHLLQSLFKSPKLFKKVFHNVYIFRPLSSKSTVKDDIFNHIPSEQEYFDLNEETLSDVISKLEIDSMNDYNSCIIFDDMASKLKNNDTMSLFKDLIFNRRHLRCSVFFLVQTWHSIPAELRRSFSNMFIFRVSKNELETIFRESIELDTKFLVPLSKIVYDVPFNFLFVNLDGKRFFKNWNELIIEDS